MSVRWVGSHGYVWCDDDRSWSASVGVKFVRAYRSSVDMKNFYHHWVFV